MKHSHRLLTPVLPPKLALVPTVLLALVLTVPALPRAGAEDKAGTAARPDQNVAPRSSRGDFVSARGALGEELFISVARGNLEAVQVLLKKGADPNARNTLDMTPLFIAAGSGQIQVIEALLGAGAQVDPETPYGSPLTSACLAGAEPAIQLLLSRGAKTDVVRPDGITQLMLVSRANLPGTVHELLRRKADANAVDIDGASALVYAAREGQTEICRLLLAAGAKVDVPDSHGWTPLTYAAVSGRTEFVRLLLKKGASPSSPDASGRTPLLLTVMYGDHPEVVHALLTAGAGANADSRVADAEKRSAYAVALARGHRESARLLSGAGPGTNAAAKAPKRRTSPEALALSVKALERSMSTFSQMAGCVSCHHEGLGWTATGTAGQRGFALSPKLQQVLAKRVNRELDTLRPALQEAVKDGGAMKHLPLIEMGDLPIYYGYLLAGMAANKVPPTETAGAMAMVIARQQLPDGHWMFGLPRVPMESSNFTMTALSIEALRSYGPKTDAREVGERISKAKTWLLAGPVESSEDRAMRLLGLKWAGASPQERQKALDALRGEQRPDGGWPQLPALQSDAYATGQALYALHVGGGLPAADPAYQRGVQFLLRTQEADGSWFVNKRALPVNNYFDAGFPHGVSQYASFNATCWATMALAQTVVPPQQAAADRNPRRVARPFPSTR